MNIWKDIPGYEGFYQASIFGEIKSLPKNGTGKNSKILKPSTMPNKYSVVTICKNGIKKPTTVHKLIAITFLPNIGETVDHIDGNKTNNKVENLRWCTHRENTSFRSQNIKNKSSKYIGVCLNKKSNKYISKIRVGKEQRYLGSYLTEEEAHYAYQLEMIKISKKK